MGEHEDSGLYRNGNPGQRPKMSHENDAEMYLRGPNNFNGLPTATEYAKTFTLYGKDPAEIRVTDPRTGAQKGQKKAKFSLIPWKVIWRLAEHYGKCGGNGTKEKYAVRNWEKGYVYSLSFDALHRHLALWWNGEENDPETGSHHLICAAWHCFALLTFGDTHPEMDDRPGHEVQ